MQAIGFVMLMYGLSAPPHWEIIPPSSAIYPLKCEPLLRQMGRTPGVKRPDGSDPVCIVRVEEDEAH